MPSKNELFQAAKIAAVARPHPADVLPEFLQQFIIAPEPLSALNQAVAALLLFIQQANLVYSCRLLARLLPQESAVKRVTAAGWFGAATEQIAKRLNLLLSEAISLAWPALLRPAGLPDKLETVDFDARLVPILASVARLSPAAQSFSGLPPAQSTPTGRLKWVGRGGEWEWAGCESKKNPCSGLGVRIILDRPSRQKGEGILQLDFTCAAEGSDDATSG